MLFGVVVAPVLLVASCLALGGSDGDARRHADAFCAKVEIGMSVEPLDGRAETLDGWNAGGTGPGEWPGHHALIYAFEGDSLYLCQVAVDNGRVIGKRLRTVPKS